MALWMVRAGRQGEREDLALEQGIVAVGWQELPSLEGVGSREALEARCREVYSDEKLNTIRNWVGQLWAFTGRIREGDLVALPLKAHSAIAVGRITGPYRYRPDRNDVWRWLVRSRRPSAHRGTRRFVWGRITSQKSNTKSNRFRSGA